MHGEYSNELKRQCPCPHEMYVLLEVGGKIKYAKHTLRNKCYKSTKRTVSGMEKNRLVREEFSELLTFE